MIGVLLMVFVTISLVALVVLVVFTDTMVFVANPDGGLYIHKPTSLFGTFVMIALYDIIIIGRNGCTCDCEE